MYPMRIFTSSGFSITSMPSTTPRPLVSGRIPVSILITVVLPEPFGPRKPNISPGSTLKLTPSTAMTSPNLRTKFSAMIADIISPRVAQELHVGIDAGAQTVLGVLDAQLHSKHLVLTLLLGLDIARQKLRLLADLLDHRLECAVRVGVDLDFRRLTDSNRTDLVLRDVNDHVELIRFEQLGNRGIRRYKVARTHVEYLDDRVGWGADLALVVTRLRLLEFALGTLHVRACGRDIFSAETFLGKFLRRFGRCKVGLGHGHRVLSSGGLRLRHLVAVLSVVALFARCHTFLVQPLIPLVLDLGVSRVSACTFGSRRGFSDRICAGRAGGASLANLFRPIPTQHLRVVGPGLRISSTGLEERRIELGIVERNEKLVFLHMVALSNKNFCDAPSDFGSNAHVAGFQRSRCSQRIIAVKPRASPDAHG